MQLKRKIAFALCLVYLTSMLSVALSLHFCGGHLADVSVASTKTACRLCKNEPVAKKDDGCCKNTKVDLKVKDNHQSAVGVKLAKLFSADLFFSSTFWDWNPKPIFSLKSIFANKAPPKGCSIAIYLLHCVFRN